MNEAKFNMVELIKAGLPPEIANNSVQEELNFFNLHDLLQQGVPEIEWVVQNILPKGGICFFGGSAGSYKSWVAMQLGLSVASGKPFLDSFTTQKAKVLYVDEENGTKTTPFRFDMLRKGHEINEEHLKDVSVSIFSNIQLDTPTGKEKFDLLIQQSKAEVVILDSMVRCMSGDENSAGDVRRLYETLKKYLKQGISFILLHHTTKSNNFSMSGLRGSGDFSAFSDSVLMFQSSGEGYCDIKPVKNRHVAIEELQQFFFKIKPKKYGLFLEYCGERVEGATQEQKCVEKLQEYMKTNSLGFFDSSKMAGLSQDWGFSRSCYYNAKTLLENQKVISKLKKGKYEINKDSFIVDIEGVT